jgi:hypothetical protein
MKKIFKFASIFSVTVLFPVLAYAQGVLPSRQTVPFSSASSCVTNNQLGYIICTANDFLRAILPLLVSLGVIYFVWGVVQYFIGDSEEAKTKGRDRIIFGIIGLAVIISVWGLVYLLADTFGLSGKAAQDVSNLVTQSSSSCSLANGPKLSDLLDYFTCVIGKSVIPFLFALAVLMFIWGAIKFFIINSDEEAKREQGKQFMIWGIIALAVMVSVWGLVNILGTTFGVRTNVLPTVQP